MCDCKLKKLGSLHFSVREAIDILAIEISYDEFLKNLLIGHDFHGLNIGEKVLKNGQWLPLSEYRKSVLTEKQKKEAALILAHPEIFRL